MSERSPAGRGAGKLRQLKRTHHGPARREQLARESWRLLMKVAEKQMDKAGERLYAIGLSPVMGHFLDEVARMGSASLGQLASRMAVDPGWVTDVVDKLEERGDVRRVPFAEDRRVKFIELTDKGRDTWRRMDDAIASAPRELLEMSEHELRSLLRLAERLADAAGIEPGPEI